MGPVVICIIGAVGLISLIVFCITFVHFFNSVFNPHQHSNDENEINNNNNNIPQVQTVNCNELKSTAIILSQRHNRFLSRSLSDDTLHDIVAIDIHSPDQSPNKFDSKIKLLSPQQPLSAPSLTNTFSSSSGNSQSNVVYLDDDENEEEDDDDDDDDDSTMSPLSSNSNSTLKKYT